MHYTLINPIKNLAHNRRFHKISNRNLLTHKKVPLNRQEHVTRQGE